MEEKKKMTTTKREERIAKPSCGSFLEDFHSLAT